jgi:hypothetical protein
MVIVVAEKHWTCPIVNSVDVEALLIVVTELVDSSNLSWPWWCSIGGVNVSWVAEIWAWSIYSGIGVVFNLLSNEIISLFAHASIESFYKMRVFGALWTFSIYSDVSFFTEAAAFIKIFMEIAYWRDERLARGGSSIINFPVGASSTSSIDKRVSKDTHACLFWWWIFLIDTAYYSNTSVIDKGKAIAASTGIILWKIWLINWASLANILNDY